MRTSANGLASRGTSSGVGLHEPGLDLLRRLQAEFGLHDLTIEDALKAHQRPKLEQYGEAVFIVARMAQMFEGRIVLGETHLFVGHDYVFSVRYGAPTSYAPVRECWRSPQRCAAGSTDTSARTGGYKAAISSAIAAPHRSCGHGLSFRLTSKSSISGNPAAIVTDQ